MTLQEFYPQVGGSYESVLSRLFSEALIRRFVLKYGGDPTFERLDAALAAQDWEAAFLAVHTLKGTAANLGFDRMYQSASLLTEELRGPKPLENWQLWEAVKKEQACLLESIQKLQET